MEPVVSKLTFANFRSIFQPQVIDFGEMGSVVALYGRNGAGKSNTLKALRAIVDIMIHSGDVDYKLPYNYFHYLTEAAVRPTMFGIEIKDDRHVMNYSFAFNANEIVYESLKIKSRRTNKHKVIFLRRKRELVNSAAANYGFSEKLLERTLSKTLLLTKAYEDNNAYAKFIFDAVKRIEFVSMESGKLEAKVATILNSDSDLKDWVLNEFSKLEAGVKEIRTANMRGLDDLLAGLAVESDLIWRLAQGSYVDVKLVREYNGVEYPESINDESSGNKAILNALTMIRYAFENNLMLCMDEFGSFLNPVVAEKIIGIYNNFHAGNRLLITTHQLGLYDCIGRAERVIVRKDEKTGETYLEQRKPSTSLRKLREDKKEAKGYFTGMVKRDERRKSEDEVARSFGFYK